MSNGQGVKSPPYGVVDATWPTHAKELGYSCRLVMLLDDMVNRDKEDGTISRSLADFCSKYGYKRRTAERARERLIKQGWSILRSHHSNEPGSSNSYEMLDASCFNEFRAKRKAADTARRESNKGNAIVAPPSFTPPSERTKEQADHDKAEAERGLAQIADRLRLERIAPLVSLANTGVR